MNPAQNVRGRNLLPNPDAPSQNHVTPKGFRDATKFRDVTERNDSRRGSGAQRAGQGRGRVRSRTSRVRVPEAGPRASEATGSLRGRGGRRAEAELDLRRL